MTPKELPAFRSAAAVVAFSLLSAGFASAQDTPADRDEVVHVLNRVTFGPAPGDVELVEKMGVRAYIEQQLHPETIDDSAVDQQLAQFDMLQMSSSQLLALYKEERQKARLRQHQEAVAAAAAAGGNAPVPLPATAGASTTPGAPMENQPPQLQQMQPPAPGPVITPANFSPAPNPGLRPNLLQTLNANRTASVVGQLQQARLLRDVESKRQLQEVLVDFWGNHFNIDVKKTSTAS